MNIKVILLLGIVGILTVISFIPSKWYVTIPVTILTAIGWVTIYLLITT